MIRFVAVCLGLGSSEFITYNTSPSGIVRHDKTYLAAVDKVVTTFQSEMILDKANKRFTVHFDLGVIYFCRSATGLVHLVVVDKGSSERHAVGLLAATQQLEVESKTKMTKALKRVVDNYVTNVAGGGGVGGVKYDKLATVQQKVDEVVGVMQDNIHKVLANTAALEVLEDQTTALATTAAKFQRDSRRVRVRAYWDKIKMRMLGGAVATVALGAVVVPIVV
eukprot:GILJ01017645.1.p3 GENE.GILJ01017645.1~~GILJ01017645.1.p3  ORF type:complete len:222 (-),score=29.67 GILJ01017645.1:1338-2003(-)